MTRLLVAGLGLVGARHARLVQEHPDCQLVGVIDPIADLRAPFDVAGFDSIDAVNIEADGIILATPTQLHADHAELSAARGWPMLIEKPVAHTQADAARISALRVPILVGHHRRHHAGVQRLREIVANDIGQPITATCLWAMAKPDSYFHGNWRDAHAGSPILINLVHDIDLLRFVLGDVVEIAAMGASPKRRAGRVESGAVMLRFDSNAIATIAFADTTPSPWGFEAATGENPNIAKTGQDMLFIAGTEGAVSFPSLTLWSGAQDWGEAAQARRVDVPVTAPLDAQLAHFLDVIAGTEPLISARDASETLRVALSAQTAAHSERIAA